MKTLTLPQHYDLFAKGYNAFGQSPLTFSGNEVNQRAKTYFSASTPSNFVMDGDVVHRLNVVDGYMQSDGFVTGSTGWRIDSDGNAEFESGDFRGDITGATGAFSGSLAVGTNGWHVDTDGNMWWGSSATYASATIKISNAGVVNLTSGTFTGALTAGAGSSLNGTYLTNNTVTSAKVTALDATKITTGTLVVARTQAKCTDATADKTSTHTAADTAKVQGSTIISGGYIATSFLSATNIQAGTLTGRTIRTAAPGAATGSAIVITGGSGQNINFYYNATSRGYIGGYTTEGAETTYIRIIAASGRYIKLKNSFVSVNGNLNPSSGNTYTLGSSGEKWSTLYCQDAHVTHGYTGDVYVATSNGGSPTKKLDIEEGIVYDR